MQADYEDAPEHDFHADGDDHDQCGPVYDKDAPDHVWGLAGNEMLLILLIFSFFLFNIFSLFVCLRSGVWQAARCCSCSVLPQLLSSLSRTRIGVSSLEGDCHQ